MKQLFYIAFFIISLSLTANDNLRLQYHYANQLFDQEKYFEAITEFKRLQFFDEENTYLFEANFKIGVAYKKGGFYQNAIEYLTKAKSKTDVLTKQNETEFEIVRCNILRSTFARAHQLLDLMESNPRFKNSIDEINYWRGWVFMLDDKWDSASVSFGKISQEHELNLLCEQVNEDKYSVTFARVISYILPGAGQIYTGNYFSGFMSLTWNVLLGYLTFNAFAADRVFDGAAIGSLLWLRFYRGNIQNADKLAENANSQIANKALFYLMENYKGEKP